MPKRTMRGRAPKHRANPEMVTLARLARGQTQGELADMLRITQGKVSKIESGVISASSEMLARMSVVLRYPTDFFCRADVVYGLGISELFHRKRQNAPTKVLGKIHAQSNIYRMNVARLLQSVEIEDHRFPFWDAEDSELSPEDAAQYVRAVWRLPPGPVMSVVRIVESQGAIVLPFSFETSEVDAISQYMSGLPPMFFTNEDLSMAKDRLRFSLCHEVGHLVMHQYFPSDFKDVERQANRFASEFLMPESDIAHELDGLTLSKLAALKQRWRVSMSALIVRAKDLERISERQARSLWTHLAKLGYTRKREPAELKVREENPTLLRDLLAIHIRELGYTVEQLAQLLTLEPEEFKRDYLGLKGHLNLVG